MKALSTSILSVLLLLFFACSLEVEYAVDTTTVQLYPAGTVVLSVTPADGAWVFRSANNNIASVSESGVITGNHTGTTTVKASNAVGGFDAEVEVNVTAVNTLFREPCPDYFVNDATVKAYESRELVSSGSLLNGVTYLLYRPDNYYHQGVMYLFDENKRYFMSEVIVFDWCEDKLNAHLNDRYIPMHTYSNQFVSYMSPDSTTLVYKKTVADTYMNIYLPVDYAGPVFTYSWSIF